MRKIILTGTTVAATGAFTVNGPTSVLGLLHAIRYVPGSIDTGATITVTIESPFSGSKTLLVKASAGTSSTTFYPRDLSHKTADGAALTDQTTLPLLDGTPRFVMASGGATAGVAGTVVIYYED